MKEDASFEDLAELIKGQDIFEDDKKGRMITALVALLQDFGRRASGCLTFDGLIESVVVRKIPANVTLTTVASAFMEEGEHRILLNIIFLRKVDDKEETVRLERLPLLDDVIEVKQTARQFRFIRINRFPLVASGAHLLEFVLDGELMARYPFSVRTGSPK